MATVTFTQDTDRTHIETPFDRGFISAIKNIDGHWPPHQRPAPALSWPTSSRSAR